MLLQKRCPRHEADLLSPAQPRPEGFPGKTRSGTFCPGSGNLTVPQNIPFRDLVVFAQFVHQEDQGVHLFTGNAVFGKVADKADADTTCIHAIRLAMRPVCLFYPSGGGFYLSVIFARGTIVYDKLVPHPLPALS